MGDACIPLLKASKAWSEGLWALALPFPLSNKLATTVEHDRSQISFMFMVHIQPKCVKQGRVLIHTCVSRISAVNKVQRLPDGMSHLQQTALKACWLVLAGQKTGVERGSADIPGLL